MGIWDFIRVWAKHFFDKWVTFPAKIPFVIIGARDVLDLKNQHRGSLPHIYNYYTFDQIDIG